MVDTRTAPGGGTADATSEAQTPLRLHSAAHTLDVAHALQVKLSYPGQGPEKNRVKPGEPVDITIRTTDAQGRPVPAEVSLAVVEEVAGIQFREPPQPGIQEFFRGAERPLSVRTGSSIEFAYHPTTTPVNQPLSAQRVRPVASGPAGTSEPPAAIAPPPSVAHQARPDVPPGMPPLPGAPAQNSWPALTNSERSDEPASLTESAAARWDTAYWNAAVTTDSAGTATVQVNLPRRLATWKIVAQGITQQSVAGEAVETLVAEQELYAELKVPEALVSGDETEVVAVVRNQRPEPVSVDALVAVTVAGQTVEQKQSVAVSARGREELRFPVAGPVPHVFTGAGAATGDSAHAATIRLTVAQGDASDVVERTIPVRPDGVSVLAAQSGVAESARTVTIDPPAGAARDSLHLRLSVRASVEEALWDAVMTPQRDPGGGSGQEPTTDSLSSDLMAVLGIQQLLQFPVPSPDPRAGQLKHRTCVTIAELVSAQLVNGSWGWALGASTGDRYATARAVWALSLARRAGHRVPDDCLQKAVQFLTQQLAETAPHDGDTKAILLHALSTAGQPDFSLGNRLHRERAQLSTPALLYLALALVEMDRLSMAGELLSLCEQRMGATAGETDPEARTTSAVQSASAEWWALRALVLIRTAPEATTVNGVIDQVLAHRRGLRWAPDRATGPAVLALCRWFDRYRPAGQNRTIKVSINDQPAQIVELPEGPGPHVVEMRADQLVEGSQRVLFEPAAPGRYVYDIQLSGVLRADQLQTTTQTWHVARSYAPAPRELSGRTLSRGFDIVRDKAKAFDNALTQLPVDQRGQVELQITRRVAEEPPAEMRDYLIVAEPIPSGVIVLPETIEGPHECVHASPGQLTFYLGRSHRVSRIRYEVVGQFAGASRAGATVVSNAYRQEERAVVESRHLSVLARGATSADAYRWSPQELYELGEIAHQQHDWPRAELLLAELMSDWSLEPGPYRDTVKMLLDAALELQKPDQIVRYFEIVFEQWPEEEFVLDKVMRIGAAYQELGEAERSFQVFRTAVEGAFTREGGVAGVLGSIGKRMPSARVMQRLLCEYPPEPYAATAHLALAQQLATWAPAAAEDPALDAAGMRAADLLRAAWRMQEDFLTEYPLAPTADQAAFAAASALLETKDYARAAVVAQRAAARYSDSDLLDDFWFIAGYCRFLLGESEPAIELLRNVATGKFRDAATGQLGDSDNKWSSVYVLGQLYHSLDQVVAAIDEYRLVEDRFPDAKASIADFLREVMRLPDVTTVRPGKPVAIELTYRNVATCDLKVYRIDLEKFAVLRQSLGGIRDINLAGIQPYRGATVELGEGKDYRDVRRELPLDLTEVGAYLVVCRGGSQFASGLVLVTPWELEVVRDPQTATARITLKDVTNDQYVHGADVKVIRSGKAETVAGQTDRRGLFVAEEVAGDPTVIARAGDGKFALYRGAGPLPLMASGGAKGQFREAAALLPGIAKTWDATGIVLSGPGDNLIDQRVFDALNRPTTLKFEETPLEDVARLIMQQHEFTVLLDRQALDDVGLGGETPVTFEVSDMSLGAALTLLLKQLDLTYVVRHEALQITTPEEAENELTTVAYPVTDLIRYRDPDGKLWSDYDTLIETITSTIAPSAWDEVGGAGGIEPMPIQDTDVLVVSQTREVQEMVVSMLQRLRAIAHKDRPEGDVPMRERPEYPPSGMPPGAVEGFGAGMGGFGGFGAGPDPTVTVEAPAVLTRGSATSEGAELLRGLDATKRRLQGKQIDDLQRLYDQGKRGMGGGVGAGGFF